MRRVALILTALFISASTLTGLAPTVGDSPGIHTACTGGPDISLTDFRHTEFYSCVDQLFNERFPYRDPLRRTKALVDYYVFRSSPVSEVHVGTDGWLYYRDELDDYRKTACGEEDAARALARSFQDIERVIVTSGKRFVLVVAPNKSTIYPEYVGLKQSQTCGKSFYDLFLAALEEYPVSGFIRVDQLLLEAKRRKQVYFKTDTHWNEVGAHLVASRILLEFPQTTWRADLEEVTITSEERRGDLARLMGLNVEETVQNINMKPHQFVELVEPGSPPFRYFDHIRVNPQETADRILLPRAVFYRDSFMVILLKFLKGAFEQIDTYWFGEGANRFPAQGSEETLRDSKIVFVEVVERQLPFFKIGADVIQGLLGANSALAGS